MHYNSGNWRIRFSKVCITIAMFKLALAINLLLMEVAPPFEQTLITHNQGLFVVQYLRILFTNFGEENFQRFAFSLLCSNCLWLLFHK